MSRFGIGALLVALTALALCAAAATDTNFKYRIEATGDQIAEGNSLLAKYVKLATEDENAASKHGAALAVATGGGCYTPALEAIRHGCQGMAAMSANHKSTLALSLYNCHVLKHNRSDYTSHACPDGADVSACTAPMSTVEFTMFTAFDKDVDGMCLALITAEYGSVQAKMSSAMFDALHDTNAGVQHMSRVVEEKSGKLLHLQEAMIRGQKVVEERVVETGRRTIDSINDTNIMAAKMAVDMRDLKRLHEERNMLFAERELQDYGYMVAAIVMLFVFTHDAAQMKTQMCMIVLMAFAEYTLYPGLHVACRGLARGNLLHVDSHSNNVVLHMMAIHPAFWPLPPVPLRGALRGASVMLIAYSFWRALFARPQEALAGYCVNCSCARCGNKPIRTRDAAINTVDKPDTVASAATPVHGTNTNELMERIRGILDADLSALRARLGPEIAIRNTNEGRLKLIELSVDR